MEVLYDHSDERSHERNLAFNHNPFPSMRWRISRKTRETLFDLHVADELLQDSSNRSYHGHLRDGIVTNDPSLHKEIENERRLEETGFGATMATARLLHGDADQDEDE
jgi:hypothetical protein